MLTTEKQSDLIRLCMALAAQTASEGNLPFAAVLTDNDGEVVLRAVNTVHTTNNAAAHAEINLLYDAGKKLGRSDLSDYVVVSNAASCPMCITALIKAKITEFYYGAPNEGTMIPNIPMDQIIAATPHPIEVYGGILESECAAQIAQLAKR